MSARDLCRQPVWQAAELGRPIPDSPHAVSMALPRWQDVVGYEEKRPETMARLSSGYPRFVIHPLVQALSRELAREPACLPFPSRRAAEEAAAFVVRHSGEPAEVRARGGLHGVVTTEAGLADLRSFWQHTGLIVSTRQAEAFFGGSPPDPDGREVLKALRRRVAEFYDCAEDDVLLAPTGMAAHYAALRAINARSPGLPTAQLGFPYVDTFKLQEKLGFGGILLHQLAGIEAEVATLLRHRALGGCFCEIPGNPLLGSADLRKITPLLRAHATPLVADDVVATPLNVDLSGHADLIATSLTKFIAGTGDVMGGALVCNPRSPYHAELKAHALARHEELLWQGDAEVLLAQAAGFPERMRQHNRSGLLLAERLRAHPRVERVWYPKWEFSEVYEAVRRPQGGWSALITFLPRQAESRAPGIFDRLEVCKGPSLGTVFTLACPFTLLAHYTELAWAESCGLSRHLIRLSIGLEDPEDLWRRLDAALQSA